MTITTVTPDTLVKVIVSAKDDDDATEFYCIAPWKFIPRVLGWKLESVEKRIKHELDSGKETTLAYDAMHQVWYSLTVVDWPIQISA